MIPFTRICLLANALALACPVLAADSVPSVELRSGHSATVLPGGFLSATIALRFEDREPSAWRDRLILPEGWSALSPVDLPFTPVAPEEIRLIGVTVPKNAAEGTYTIHYVLAREQDPSREIARAELTVLVPSASALRVEPELAPERAIAGEPFTVSWRISNRGNHAVGIAIKARSTLGFPVSLVPDRLDLGPGSSGTVSATVTSSAAMRGEQSHAVLLELRIAEGPRTRSETVAITTHLVPRYTTDAEQEETLALSVRTRGLYRSTEAGHSTGIQTELSGQGFLDLQKTQRLDFLLRSGPISQGSKLLPGDQYSFAYRSKTLDLLLGDQLYTLSPLTQRWLFGRGAGIEYRHAPLATGIYYATTPWQVLDTEQTGAFVQLDPTKDLRLRGNLLARHTGLHSIGSDPESLIPSVQLFLQPNRINSLELEAATSENDEHPSGNAYRARLRGRWGPDVYYDVEHVRASPDFFGYYHDLQSTSGNFTWHLGPQWLARGNFQLMENNLDLDPEKPSASRVRWFSVGTDRQLSGRVTASLDLNLNESEDRLQGPESSMTQQTAMASVIWGGQKLYLRGALEGGWTDVNRPGDSGRVYRRVSLSANARPRPDLTYALYVSFGDSRYSAASQKDLTAIASTTWDAKNGFRLTGALSLYRTVRGETTNNVAAQTDLAYDFRGGSSVDLGVRASGITGGSRDRMVIATYTLPLRVRSPMRKNRGSLEGVLQLDSPAGTSPIAGATLLLDHLQASTDRQGRFVFPSVKAGRYTLRMDQASVTAPVAFASQPVEVVIERGRRATVRLAVQPAARLEGRVGTFEAAMPSSFEESKEGSAPLRLERWLSQVLIEARAADGAIRRTVTDEWGRFAFDRLPAGEWTILIDERAVPPRHRLEQGVFTLKLQPGETQKIEGRVVPIVRPVKMIDVGWIGPKPAAPELPR
ncbi:hypothetical protein DB347_04945 [Opitutaceae bacterium EW11]|nr:hypothetical protein DB347_04945 [Opitutaceae bacterium EW11]